MALLYSVFGFLPVPSYSDPGLFDMLSALPFEMAIYILRLLPGKDLLNAACTSSRWLWLCRSDKQLRRTIGKHLRRLARQRMRAVITDNIAGRRGRASSNASDPERPRVISDVHVEYRVQRNQMAVEGLTQHEVRGSVSRRVHRYSPYRRESARVANLRSEPENSRRRVFRM